MQVLCKFESCNLPHKTALQRTWSVYFVSNHRSKSNILDASLQPPGASRAPAVPPTAGLPLPPHFFESLLLMIDESENDEVIESITIPETSKSLMKTNKSFRNHTQNRTERKHKQQQNGLKPIQGGSIAIIGDSMLKALNPSKLRRSTGKKISVKTFPGATTSDMNHYVKPTLDRNPELLVLHVGTNNVQRKEPQEIANEVESLCRSIVRNGMTRIALSEIIQRQDEDLNIKIRETNLLL